MALIKEVADKIYEIKPEGKGLDCFPLGTVYLVADDKSALVETGCPVQAPDIMEAMTKLGVDIEMLSYIIPTHVHGDHAGGAGLLVQQMRQAHVVALPKVARFLSDASMLTRLTHGFKQIFGEQAEERFGMMKPVPQEKFVLVEDGKSVSLGGRELKAISTPGHAPHHLSFLDTRTRGLFCGDAFGGYFPEIEVILPSSTPGSDPDLTLRSMEKLKELNPEFVFFSHGSSTREAAKILQLGLDQARQCKEIALEALKAGEDKKGVTRRLIEVLARGSVLARSELLEWPYLSLVTLEGYRQYLEKKSHDSV